MKKPPQPNRPPSAMLAKMIANTTQKPMQNDVNSAQTNQLYQQAVALHQQGKIAQAKTLYEEILQVNAQHFEALHLLGVIACQTNDHLKSVALIRQAMLINPNNAASHSNLGLPLKALKRYDEALQCYDRAIALMPGANSAEAYDNRGILLMDINRHDEALQSFDYIIALKPDYASAYNNRGIALRDLSRLEEALQSYDKAIALKQDYAEAYTNRGNALQELMRLDEALKSHDSAIMLRPNYTNAYWNKALLYILMGNYEEGWQLFEWRRKKEDLKSNYPSYTQPLWLGEEPLQGKTILLYAEQGLGDTLQFCRYAKMVEKLGAKVVLSVPRALVALMSSLEGNFIIVAQGQPLPAFDYQTPLMSLPLAFKTTVETIPAKVPYLFADAAKQDFWQAKLGAKNKLRVGLVWSGSADHKNDRRRSLPLAQLAKLLNKPFAFHCLQKEIREVDQTVLKQYPQLQLHQADLKDFSDTAALVAELDIVISADTSVAHLAGALGKTVWVLLPYAPDYRWMLDRTDSLWYPNAKLFRQPKAGDWESVIAEMTQALAHISKENSLSWGA